MSSCVQHTHLQEQNRKVDELYRESPEISSLFPPLLSVQILPRALTS